jgi:hypothetical protein
MNDQGFFRIDNQPHRLSLSGDYADAVVFSDACSVVDSKPPQERVDEAAFGARVDDASSAPAELS